MPSSILSKISLCLGCGDNTPKPLMQSPICCFTPFHTCLLAALCIFLWLSFKALKREANTYHQLRNNRTNNRSARAQTDHDIMEGLPVRQWKKIVGPVNLAPPREDSNAAKQVGIWKELPMPRGSELYSPMSQALLRAARMGQMHKLTAPPQEEDKDAGDEEDAEGEPDTTIIVSRWTLVPKNMEEPEPEYLAKRRRGLPSIYGGASNILGQPPAMRKTKVRKIDAEGNVHVYDVMAPEGTSVEGEIIEDEAITTQAAAPGTVVEGVGVANAEGVVVVGEPVQPTPTRRKPPPPKRKPKGPGRGRKKKMIPAPGTHGLNGAVNDLSVMKVDGLTTESQAAKHEATAPGEVGNHDVVMGDDSLLQDGEEGSSSDEEEGEDGDREEGEIISSPDPDPPLSTSGSPSKQPPTLPPPPVLSISNPEIMPAPPKVASSPPGGPIEAITRDASSSPDIALAAKSLPIPDKIITPIEDAIAVSVPAEDDVDTMDGIEIAQPEVSLNTNLEIPIEHNPLDGLVEPQVVDLHTKAQDVTSQDLGFAPEEDLFGSLEKQLDDKS